MKIVTVIICLCAWTILHVDRAAAVSDEEYCQWETFRPQCLPGETVIFSKAIYGRMSDDARCLQDEIELVALKDDPMYMGCLEDVLPLVSARCSGRPSCEIRIPDPEMEKTNPCYRHMAKYLEVTYQCVKVVQPDRSCQVAVNTEQIFFLPSSPKNGTNGDGVLCGSEERAWQLEAPSGQRINISLLDLSGSSSSTWSVQRAPAAVEMTSSGRCLRRVGFIDDKSANRHIDICSDVATHRQQTLYVSLNNQLDIVLHTTQPTAANFLIAAKAVGCSDLVPPSDAWLKRSDNVATVGCYMTRQRWILTCDHNGRWTGTFGNCTQQLLAIQESSEVKMQPAKSQPEMADDYRVIILVAIIGVSSVVCVIIICVGVTWLCRLRGTKSRDRGYSGDDLLTSVDGKSAAHHTNGFE